MRQTSETSCETFGSGCGAPALSWVCAQVRCYIQSGFWLAWLVWALLANQCRPTPYGSGAHVNIRRGQHMVYILDTCSPGLHNFSSRITVGQHCTGSAHKLTQPMGYIMCAFRTPLANQCRPTSHEFGAHVNTIDKRHIVCILDSGLPGM